MAAYAESQATTDSLSIEGEYLPRAAALSHLARW
jgi:hypothetical protein